MYRKCYAKIENNSQKNQVVDIVLFRGYTLRLLMLWVSVFLQNLFLEGERQSGAVGSNYIYIPPQTPPLTKVGFILARFCLFL